MSGLFGTALGGCGISEGSEATDGPATGFTGVIATLAIGLAGRREPL